jgi:Histidine kinase-, DNA gyrase B-, and HSP90-like ATPase/STAS domain
MYEVISAAIDDNRPRSDDIIFDFSSLAFVDPNGMTVLSNLLEWLQKRGTKIKFRNCDASKIAIQYLDDCGFFTIYEGAPLRIFASARSTTMPLRKISCAESHGWLDQRAFPWLAAKLQVSTASIAEFKTCVREIFTNIQDHSTEDIGCIHIQFYPNEHRIRISVSDFGIGIPDEIRKQFRVPNDAAAIALAIQEGVSSKRGGHNRGAGLPYLIDNVVGRNGGWVGIYSSRGQLTCSPSENGIATKPRLVNSSYPGTMISIDLRTDRIEPADEQEDLEW